MSYLEDNGTFTFDGVNSADYGVWITGANTYSAPPRRFEEITIPGKNGVLTLDQRAFEDIEQTYPAFISRNFPSNIEGIRNQLLSRSGKKVLTDSYHPDEFYLAKFMQGVDVEVGSRAIAGRFDLVFKRDPRRFLKSGETTITIGEWGETTEHSGSIATFEAVDSDAVKSLKVALEPVQSGSGDPSPTNVRPISGWTGAKVWVQPTHDTTLPPTVTIQLGQTVYGGTLDVTAGTLTVNMAMVDLGSFDYYWQQHNDRFVSTAEFPGAKYPPNELTPFVGVCSAMPVIATSETVGTGSSLGIAFALNDSLARIRYPGITDATAFKAAMSGVQLVYELATPQTIQLTPQQVALLVGTNNIWSDSGDVTVEVGANPNMLVNPTLFASKPLIRVTGYGTLTVGSDVITIANNFAYVDIDSEVGDCYHGTDNANASVSFQQNDFPELAPGVTGIAYSGHITKVEITPRWWRL